MKLFSNQRLLCFCCMATEEERMRLTFWIVPCSPDRPRRGSNRSRWQPSAKGIALLSDPFTSPLPPRLTQTLV